MVISLLQAFAFHLLVCLLESYVYPYSFTIIVYLCSLLSLTSHADAQQEESHNNKEHKLYADKDMVRFMQMHPGQRERS